MRLHIVLTTEAPFLLPWNYLNMLRGVLYSAIRKSNPKLGEFLHNQGFEIQGHRYKLITFSLLFPKSSQKEKNGIKMTPPIHWWISSPLSSPLEALATTLLCEGKIKLGETELTVEKIEVEETPQFKNPSVFKTLSPIVVSAGVYSGNKLEHRFLSPQEHEFWRIVELNLRRKALVLGINVSQEPLKFQSIGKWHSKLFEIQKIKVKGWEGSFSVEGCLELIKLGYEAGFGERNAQGFGMVRVVEECPLPFFGDFTFHKYHQT